MLLRGGGRLVVDVGCMFERGKEDNECMAHHVRNVSHWIDATVLNLTRPKTSHLYCDCFVAALFSTHTVFLPSCSFQVPTICNMWKRGLECCGAAPSPAEKVKCGPFVPRERENA
jgi:hypothetical protein